jgi:peptide/nickel transport system permease protein
MLGRDYLSRLLWGARISLADRFRGDADLRRHRDHTWCHLRATSAVASTWSSTSSSRRACRCRWFSWRWRSSALIGSSLTVVIWVLGLLIWDRFAVVIRSATQQVRNLDFVASARSLGSSTWQIVTTEILPNITNHLIVIATIEMAHAILLEAALSFLGLGVQPPEPSWGLMIAEAKGMMFFEGWLIAVPGIALFLLVFAINLIGDGIRDVTAIENRR